jgi:hypothetical protein
MTVKHNLTSTGFLANRSGKVRVGVINDSIGWLRNYMSGNRHDITREQAATLAQNLIVEQDNLARPLTQDEWILIARCVC